MSKRTCSLLFLILSSTLVCSGQAKPFKPTLYIVAIGVSHYQLYPDKELKYPAHDAAAIVKKFEGSGLYDTVISFPVIDKDANRKKILALRNELMKSTVDDHVVLFFSGHGLLDPRTYNFYFCTNTFDLGNPSSTGVSFEEMEHLLDSIPSRKKLFLIDACFSGEVDKEELRNSKNFVMPLNVKVEGKPLVPVSGNVKQYSFNLMKELFIDVRKTTGSTIIASSGGLSVSYEKDDYKSGLFTYAIISSLRPGVTVSQLAEAATRTAKEISSGLQVPTVREDNIEFDYAVW